MKILARKQAHINDCGEYCFRNLIHFGIKDGTGRVVGIGACGCGDPEFGTLETKEVSVEDARKIHAYLEEHLFELGTVGPLSYRNYRDELPKIRVGAIEELSQMIMIKTPQA